MEKYLNETKGLLVMLQTTLTQEELDRCGEVGVEIWDAIRGITEKHGLNTREMLNVTLSVTHEILDIVNGEVEQTKKGMGL